MNGIEMVDEIRKVDSEIPIIYTTAFNDSQYMSKTIEQSIVSYIIKPIDIELLLKGIEKASLKNENERLKATLVEINQRLEAKVDFKTKELRKKNAELTKQLYSDDLTSLSNRKALLEDIEKADYPILVLIDIDSFKNINDLYGEEVGNEVLVNIASLLENFTYKIGCKAYRIGGDVFALLKNEEFRPHQCIVTMEELLQEINSRTLSIQKYDITIGVTATIGLSKEYSDTLEKAHMALMKAKKDRMTYVIYSDEHNLDREYLNDMKWTKVIKKAIETQNVIAYYQPIIDSQKNILKYECLMRIAEDEKIHSPFLFLDIAKKVKFYSQLAKIIIKTAFEKAKESGCVININLSIQDIVNKDIISMIERELIDNSFAHLITFEILESESITDYEKVISFINLVKNLGCKIAIDDFGSGYSNFEYLLRLQPDYIKIDGSLVKNIHTDKNAYLITKTINDFAHNLGMKTVAEFVHCKEVFDLLGEIGVDEYQGFYFSEPLENF